MSPGPRDFASIEIGARLPSRTWTANLEDMRAFGELTPARPDDPARSNNPHLNESYASRQIYGALFVDGNHTVALACQVATDWLPAGSLLSGHSEVDLRFPNPCRLGDTVTFGGEVVDKISQDGRNLVVLKIQAESDKGKVIAAGTITACVPK